MKSKLIGLILGLMLVMSPTWAHGTGHNGSRGGNSNPGNGSERGNRSNGPHNFGPRDHRRIDLHHDVRINAAGHQEIFFGGFWFICGSPYEWPLWVWSDEVYLMMVGPDTYVLYDYGVPSNEVFITVVE